MLHNNVEILFEDGEILVCLKPAGLLSQADARGGKSLLSLLEEHTGQAVYPVHRLDKETAGVMIYAKTAFAAAVLSKDIAEHRFVKEYLALVHGTPENSGEMRDLLFKDSTRNKSYVVERMRRGVKHAELSFERLLTDAVDGEEVSLVLIKLATGRTHQIRVQFAHRQMPLCGDKKYGARDGFPALQLWSYRLALTHPETKENLIFSAPPQSGAINMMLGKVQNGEN